MPHIFGLLVLTLARFAFATDPWSPDTELIARRSVHSRTFERLRREGQDHVVFLTGRFENVEFMFFADGRVVGFVGQRWFDFRDVPVVDGRGVDQDLVWSSVEDRVEVRVRHRIDKIYNSSWRLFGELVGTVTGESLAHFVVYRNPCRVDLIEANRALTDEYLAYVRRGEDDLAESLLDIHNPAAMRDRFPRVDRASIFECAAALDSDPVTRRVGFN